VGLAVVLRCIGGCGSARVGVSLLFVWGLFGDLSLFGQNKLGDVSYMVGCCKRPILQMDRMVGAL
jgi:hypothetical protein